MREMTFGIILLPNGKSAGPELPVWDMLLVNIVFISHLIGGLKGWRYRAEMDDDALSKSYF